MSLFKKKSQQGDSTVQLRNLDHPDDVDIRSPSTRWSRSSYTPVELADIDREGSFMQGGDKVNMPTVQQGLSTILGFRGKESDKKLPFITNKTSQRQYFLHEFSHTSRTKVFTAKAQERPVQYVPEEKDVLALPHNTMTFRLNANFAYCPRGYYDIVWKIQPTAEFRSPNGFYFTVNVVYDDEPDVSGSMEVALGQNVLDGLTKGSWHYLILEDRLVIHPHATHAKVFISFANNENELGQHYSGLMVEHVELRPAGTKVHTPGVLNVVVRDGARAVGTMETSEAPNGSEHISRLAFSQDSEYLAALTLLEDEARVQVWNLLQIRSLRGQKLNVSKMGAVARIRHPGIQDLAIGLTISANGDQIALFQEPRIGEWQDGTEIPTAMFPFTLYLNPLVQQETVIVDMGSDKSSPAKGPSGIKSQNGSAQPNGPLDLIPFTVDASQLINIVGYCRFLGKSKKNEDIDSNGNSGTGNSSSSDSTDLLPKFVACNGYYIDIFSVDGTTWKHSQMVTVAPLMPTLSRRITCKLMFDSMSPTMFMWLEDGGLNCSTWELSSGGNVSHIHSLENASFKGSTFRGHNKMAISPHESIVALASVDGSLTTYFIKSGMAIDDRKFPGYKIEYVGFHAQDDQLLVVLRDTGTRQLSARVLDSLQLRSEVDAYQMPIPTISSAIVCYLRRRGYFGRGIVCSSVGTRLRFHWTQALSISKLDKRNEDVVRAEPTETEFEAVFDETISYRLNTTPIRISSPEGDGKSYWLQRVELLEVSVETQVAKLLFAFAPEPWTRWATLDYTNPDALISAYFMPCGTRFVVVGTQTVQIWNLPRQDEPRVSLQFMFSKPVEDPADITNTKFVGNYYEVLETATFYQDIRHRTALMEVTMGTNLKLRKVPIPGPLGAGARLAILHAFRSMHLVANMYMFSVRDYHTIANQLYYPFTLEEHADALARFTKSHINRMISFNNLRPWEFTPAHEESKVDPSRKKLDVTSILTILLEEHHLRATNTAFIMSLLSQSNGEWIPRDHKFLNPILRAVEKRETMLVQAFLDYCVVNAKKYHPSYMMPAVQCVDKLSERYPDMLAELFRRASYIPAHNHAYVASHAIVANPDVRFRLWNKKSQEYTDYAKPVFHLRSQLPVRSASWFNIQNIESTYTNKRAKAFPPDSRATQRLREERVAAGEYNHKIYVAPFPKFSTYGPYIPWYKGEDVPESPFSRLAGKRFFDSPAMTAVLEFKWHKFAMKAWLMRLLYLFLYYGIFLVITAFQIKKYVGDNPEVPDQPISPDALRERYMYNQGWNVALRIDIALGIFMLLMEFTELLLNGWQYFMSPYNYIDVVAEVLPLISCFLLLKQNNDADKDIFEKNLKDDNFTGPHQIWWMSYSILAIYMHILFELRVIKQFGIAVNTIIKITLRTAYFLVVMGIFLLGFTHSLLHLLHTRAAIRTGDGIFTRSDTTDYPPTPGLALSATYFLLGGRWDPLNKNFEGPNASFHIMMAIFFFVTALLLLNLLIALMNDAYNDSQQEGEEAWLKQWSEIMGNIERVYLSPSEMHNSNLFPDYVYYGAPEEEAEEYESKFSISSKSNLSIENQFIIDQLSGQQRASHATHRLIQRDVSNLHQNYERLRRAQESVQKNMLTITALVGRCYRILEPPTDDIPQVSQGGEAPDDDKDEADEEYDDEDSENQESGMAADEDEYDSPSLGVGCDGQLEYQEDEEDEENEDKKVPEMRSDWMIGDMKQAPEEKKVAEERSDSIFNDVNQSKGHEGEGSPGSSAPGGAGSIPPPSPARASPLYQRRPPAPADAARTPVFSPPPMPAASPIAPPMASAPSLPTLGSTAPQVQLPAQGATPTTASPTEIEQVASPMPISESLPIPAPPIQLARRSKKSSAATTPVPGESASSRPAPTSSPAPAAPHVRTAPVHAAPIPPRHAPAAPGGRITHFPTDADISLSSPYNTQPVPGRLTYGYDQLPEPSVSMPVIVGDSSSATSWRAPYPPSHQQRLPQAPWKQSTNPAEMQALIESSYLRRKKRKGVSKAGTGGGAVTDASSAAEDDAASMRSLPLQDPLAVSSSFAPSDSQMRQRYMHPGGGSSSTPSTLPRGLNRDQLLARTMSDTAAQEQPSYSGATAGFQRTPLNESHTLGHQESQMSLQDDEGDASEQHHIEYLDQEDDRPR